MPVTLRPAPVRGATADEARRARRLAVWPCSSSAACAGDRRRRRRARLPDRGADRADLGAGHARATRRRDCERPRGGQGRVHDRARRRLRRRSRRRTSWRWRAAASTTASGSIGSCRASSSRPATRSTKTNDGDFEGLGTGGPGYEFEIEPAGRRACATTRTRWPWRTRAVRTAASGSIGARRPRRQPARVMLSTRSSAAVVQRRDRGRGRHRRGPGQRPAGRRPAATGDHRRDRRLGVLRSLDANPSRVQP